jgi:hypothetical protein
LERIEIPPIIYDGCDGLGLISEDPLSFAAGDENVRRYVGNGVANASDPTGLQDPRRGFITPPSPVFIDVDHTFPDDSHRPLTPGEIDIVRQVYGYHIDVHRVVIYNRPFWGPLNFNGYGLGGSNTITPYGSPYFLPQNYRNDFSQADIRARGLFVHEMAHVLQYQRGMNVVAEGLRTSRAYSDYRQSYSFNFASFGRPLSEFNLEQQADLFKLLYFIQEGYEDGVGKNYELYRRLRQTIGSYETGTGPRQIGPQFPPPYVEPSEEEDPTPSSHLPDDYWGPFNNDVPIYSERRYNSYPDCEG